MLDLLDLFHCILHHFTCSIRASIRCHPPSTAALRVHTPASEVRRHDFQKESLYLYRRACVKTVTIPSSAFPTPSAPPTPPAERPQLLHTTCPIRQAIHPITTTSNTHRNHAKSIAPS